MWYKITVFGGSGFLGRYIVQQLGNLDYKIRVVVRKPNNALFLKVYGKVGQIEIVRGDISDSNSIKELIGESECVINCVAIFYETNKQKFNNIALIGHMGSGKSTIGKLLAKKLNFYHIDSDRLIEKKYNKTIKEIFTENGEEFFRNIEEEAILNIQQNNCVLSLGGGAILRESIRNLLKNKFITIFLDVDIMKLVDRLQKSSKRPLLINSDIEKKIKELDLTRRKFYLLADITIRNINDPLNAVNIIMEKYKILNE